MKNKGYKVVIFLIMVIASSLAKAQCAMCTKTASQLGEKPALGLNNAILYLMLTPFAVIGVIAWRWLKNRNK